MSNLIGQSLGRYHILEQIGEGGMAIVYKAYDTRLESNVAIKVIRVEKITPEMLERSVKRFEREAKALAKLEHPNIVSVIDYGEFEGQPFLVMPFIPGKTLKHALMGKPMPYAEATRLLVPIARALGYAHHMGIIHRDVKPSNILMTTSGEPMLSDFGVAKMVEEEATLELTGTNASVGTPEYMAPEQVTSKIVDHRADIYALGIVMYEMLTGRKPFQADTPMAVLFKQASDPLPAPRRFNSGISEFAELILYKALAKLPANRFETMEAFASALEKSTSVKPTGLIKNGKFTHSLSVIGAVFLFAIVAVGYYRLQNEPFESRPGQPSAAAPSTDSSILIPSVLPVTKAQPTKQTTFIFNDNFDGTAEINTDLWRLTNQPPCTYAQTDGAIIISNEISSQDIDCLLTIKSSLPVNLTMFSSFEAKIMVESDHNGKLVNQGLYVTTNDVAGGSWWAFCGTTVGQDFEPSLLFDITNYGAGKSPDITQREPASYKIWYKFQLVFDPQTAKVSCYINEQLWASFIPTDQAELIAAKFKFHLDAWRTPDSFVSSYFDDVKVLP